MACKSTRRDSKSLRIESHDMGPGRSAGQGACGRRGRHIEVPMDLIRAAERREQGIFG